jgi:hypothetical protein
MRADMFKVIVERPRSGSRVRWSSGYRRFLDSEDLPPKVSMQRGRNGGKWLNENLAPLRRFLVRQAGRPWNDVFSEICQVIDSRSTVKQHVRSHIEDIVAVKTKLVDGEIYETGGYSAVYTPLSKANQALYVDPLTGVLMRNMEPVTWRQKQRALENRSRAELDKRMRVLSPQEELHRLGGVWFLVRLEPVPAMRIETRLVGGERRHVKVLDSRWDCLIKEHVQGREYPRWPAVDVEKWYPYRYRGMYAASKRQLSSRELRRFGLR